MPIIIPCSLAIIQNLKTAEQKIYHEEDKVGEAYVKKILRNKVIISIDNGDQLLTVEAEDFGKPHASSLSQLKEHRSFENQQDPDIDDSFALAKPERIHRHGQGQNLSALNAMRLNLPLRMLTV